MHSAAPGGQSPQAPPQPPQAPPRRPLSGVRVLDLTNVLAGPYCSYQLALLGAEVVKVELPGQGDLARRLGSDPGLNAAGIGASFLAQNAGKKSVELDLKDPGDQAVFRDMAGGADVLLENFRAGVLDRLGFGWPVLRELNPALVYCAISGFGQTGPMRTAPAYNQVIQGLSGIMSITGTPDTAPLRVGFPICDTVGGLMAALSIAAALTGRAATGQGCFLDVSMLEAAISAMGWPVSNYLVAGVTPEPMGDQNATAAPSGTFDAADGPLNIAANRQEQFETLCREVGLPGLIDDPRFAGREARKTNREALNAALNTALRGRALEWEQRLTARGVPAARILTVPQALELDQLAYRGLFTDLPYPDDSGRVLRATGSGVLVDGEPLRPETPPPLLGQHNGERELLADQVEGLQEGIVTSAEEVAQWWGTSVSRMEPGVIELRGRPVQDLIGTTSLPSMIWLLVRGSLPTPGEAALLEAALVASVDHGPQAPSIAAARMAVTCGVGLNTAIATGAGMLGDSHGGAGEQAVELLGEIRDAERGGAELTAATARVLAAWQARSRYIPGFGHRFHPLDPRRGPLLSLVADAVRDGVVDGDYLRAALAVEEALNHGRSRPVPMNIDGATAVIYAELGFAPPLARGLFVLSRSVGILAHAWEESQQGRRNKGPMPPSILPAYLGQPGDTGTS